MSASHAVRRPSRPRDACCSSWTESCSARAPLENRCCAPGRPQGIFSSLVRTAPPCEPFFDSIDPQKKSISVAAVGVPSVEMAIEKLVQAVTCIVRCLAVVFQPVTQHGPAGLKVRVIETVVARRDTQQDRLEARRCPRRRLCWNSLPPASNRRGPR
jgi:hypothetical protein